jgi:hypothetical protein
MIRILMATLVLLALVLTVCGSNILALAFCGAGSLTWLATRSNR